MQALVSRLPGYRGSVLDCGDAVKRSHRFGSKAHNWRDERHSGDGVGLHRRSPKAGAPLDGPVRTAPRADNVAPSPIRSHPMGEGRGEGNLQELRTSLLRHSTYALVCMRSVYGIICLALALASESAQSAPAA